MKVLVVAGGTGGHFYPGLSVAKELVKNGAEVRFVVRTCDVVIPLVQKDGFSYSTILAGGFQRSLSLRNVYSVLKLLIGTVQSFFVLLSFRPDVLLVMGGYLSIPPALVAKLFGIPIVMHEQNVKPGLANRLLGRWANTIGVAFEAGKKYFSGNVLVVGNPVRPEFHSLPDRAVAAQRFNLNPSKKTLLVFGGSLGARRLNDYVVQALRQMSELAGTWQVIHISGPADEERVRAAYVESPFACFVSGYCHDMASAYALADLVLCRAGASTISELAVLRKPSFLVPYPFASENHQWANAAVLADIGAAEAHDENDLAKEKLRPLLSVLLNSEPVRQKMAGSFGNVGAVHRRAAHECASLVLKTINSH